MDVKAVVIIHTIGQIGCPMIWVMCDETDVVFSEPLLCF